MFPSLFVGKVCKVLQRPVGSTVAHGSLQSLPKFAKVAILLSDIQDACHLPDITDTMFVNCTNNIKSLSDELSVRILGRYTKSYVFGKYHSDRIRLHPKHSFILFQKRMIHFLEESSIYQRCSAFELWEFWY